MGKPFLIDGLPTSLVGSLQPRIVDVFWTPWRFAKRLPHRLRHSAERDFPKIRHICSYIKYKTSTVMEIGGYLVVVRWGSV